jgi:DNA invertase Pin-like site-specific DNA recombinase
MVAGSVAARTWRPRLAVGAARARHGVHDLDLFAAVAYDPMADVDEAFKAGAGALEAGVAMLNTNGHGPNQAILYARVSTDEQARSGYSLAQQIEALRDHAAREGYEVLEEVQDAGQSGASLQRPGMDRIRDLVAAGGVSVVLAQDCDRFAREPAYHYLLRMEFAEYGCKMRALNDRGDDSPEGELTDGILDQLAKFERAKITQRTRRGKLRRAREALMARYADVVPEALENLAPEERHRVYKMLRLRVLAYPDARLEVSGVLGTCPKVCLYEPISRPRPSRSWRRPGGSCLL